MIDSVKKAALDKKAYEVAYALFRVAAILDEKDLAEVLKARALNILEGVAMETYHATDKSFSVLDYAIKLAMDLGMVNFANGEVLAQEIMALKLMIAEGVQRQQETLDISQLFSKSSEQKSAEKVPEKRGMSSRRFFSQEGIAVSRAEEYQPKVGDQGDFSVGGMLAKDAQSVAVEVAQPEHELSGNVPVGGFLKSGMRQIAILDKIRQSGSCRMRDIQEILPDSSERTIRYDLEGLIERRLIERTGNGGPSVSYRMRQN